uniref:NADH-quinone oxidoreductase subunit K n=1 Tax=Candidatus Methanomethylicus mesodigestus TaxID=1867258 RepID=A0A7C3FBF3_9CREN
MVLQEHGPSGPGIRDICSLCRVPLDAQRNKPEWEGGSPLTDLTPYLIFALALWAVGIYCLATKKNMIRLVFGIEILINTANISFISMAGAIPGFIDPLGHSIVIIVIGLSGAMSAVAITLVVYAYRQYGTLDVRELKRLRG